MTIFLANATYTPQGCMADDASARTPEYKALIQRAHDVEHGRATGDLSATGMLGASGKQPPKKVQPLYTVPTSILTCFYPDMLQTSSLLKPSTTSVRRSQPSPACQTPPITYKSLSAQHRLPLLKKVPPTHVPDAEAKMPPTACPDALPHSVLGAVAAGCDRFSLALERFMKLNGCRDLAEGWVELTNWMEVYHIEVRRDAIVSCLCRLATETKASGETPQHAERQANTCLLVHQLLRLVSASYPAVTPAADVAHAEVMRLVFRDYAEDDARKRDDIHRIISSTRCAEAERLRQHYGRFTAFHKSLEEEQYRRRNVQEAAKSECERTGKEMTIGDIRVQYWQRHLMKRLLLAWRQLCVRKQQAAAHQADKQRVRELTEEVAKLKADAVAAQAAGEETAANLRETIKALEGETDTAQRLISSLQDRLAQATGVPRR